MLAVKIIVAVACAVGSYLVCGLNPAIILSRRIYGEDIRNSGSGNAGFSNFKRVYGSKYAWWVFVLDLAKSALLPAISGLLFMLTGMGWINGVWVSGVFCLLGHAYPVWYGFHGGKGFLTVLAMAFMLDWRCGLLAFAVMTVLLLTVKIMSVSTLSGLLAGAILLWFICPSLPAKIAFTACVVFVWARHHENINRLFHGKESRFNIFGDKPKK